MLVFDTADDNKTPNKHVEAGTNDVLGRGFNSRRLHSTLRLAALLSIRDAPLNGVSLRGYGSNALSECTHESKGWLLRSGQARRVVCCIEVQGRMPAKLESSITTPPQTYFVYIFRCADESSYVGYTTNLEDRIKVHNDGRGAAWTARRRPVHLAFHEPHANEEIAISRERQLKRWSHDKKIALVNGDYGKLYLLARRRVR